MRGAGDLEKGHGIILAIHDKPNALRKLGRTSSMPSGSNFK